MVQSSLAARSVAALALMVGFYILAVGMVIGLLAIPYLTWVHSNSVPIRLIIGCGLGAAIIAWSILPRPDRFEPPGPRLTPEDHPELFKKLQNLSDGIGQKMPREVFLVQDMNAGVTIRGGIMGFGSKRVMILGLPLMQVLTVKEFEAVLAHEFGHYHGGDTQLGPWIYKTRAAIGRTLETLGDEGFLHLPFRWYGNFFLGVTQAISRAQEFSADRLAATVVGAKSLIEGLRKIHSYSPAYQAYWSEEAVPVLESGFRTPLAAGFNRFLQVEDVESQVKKILEHALVAEGEKFDSHPPLGQRISAIEDLVQPDTESPSEDAQKAIDLLGDVDACEQQLLEFLTHEYATFEPIRWRDTTDRVFIPRWRETAGRLSFFLGSNTFSDLPRLIQSRGDKLARLILGADEFVDIPEEHVPNILSGPVGSGIICALMDEGWTVTAALGEHAMASHGEAVLAPFSVTARIAEGKEGVDWWNGFIQEHGLADLILAAPAASAPSLDD